MSTQEKQSIIQSAESLVPFFEVSVSIKIFGHTIFNWSFPPKKS